MTQAQQDFYKKVFNSSEDDISIARKWLIKHNVKAEDLEDMEAELAFLFVRCSQSHVEGSKIPFDRYTWTKFKNRLIDYYREQQRNNEKGLFPIEHAVTITTSVSDFNIDRAALIARMDAIAADVFDKLYNRGWSRKEIGNALGLSPKELKRKVATIGMTIQNYVTT